jgi:hypothetical protein
MSFPGSPRVAKGAIVSIDVSNPIPQVLPFQYNPDTLTRTLKPQYSAGGQSRTEALRLKGAPIETISLDVEFDATDQLEHADQNSVAATMGILPQLAALEIILYPKSSLVIANSVLAALGTIEIAPAEEPFTLFIWGAKRILPVQLTDYHVTEEAHDINLNPIRAKVSLGMRVLTYDDLDVTHPGYSLFLAHQVVKETMAVIGSVGSISSLASGNIQLT